MLCRKNKILKEASTYANDLQRLQDAIGKGNTDDVSMLFDKLRRNQDARDPVRHDDKETS